MIRRRALSLTIASTLVVLATCAGSCYAGRGQRAPQLHAQAAPIPASTSVRLGAAAPATMQWTAPLSGASFGLMATGAGAAYAVHCIVQTIAASEAQLYIFLIDTPSASQPTNGTAAISGGVSGGMAVAGNDVTLADQTYPALTFANGLMVAASTTPGTYTAPNEGDRIRCDAKIRSTNP